MSSFSLLFRLENSLCILCLQYVSAQTSHMSKARHVWLADPLLGGSSPQGKVRAGWILGTNMWVCHFAKHYKGVPCPGVSGEERAWQGSVALYSSCPSDIYFPPGPKVGLVPARPIHVQLSWIELGRASHEIHAPLPSTGFPWGFEGNFLDGGNKA